MKELALVLSEILLLEYSAEIDSWEDNWSLLRMHALIFIYGRIFMRQNCYLSFSAHRVRETMPLSTWTQPWLSRMQRYSQIPVISDMIIPTFLNFRVLQWAAQSWSAEGWSHNNLGWGDLCVSNLWFFNFACTAELCHSKEEWWGRRFGSAAFDMWKCMGMVEWKRREKGRNLKCIVGCSSCCRRGRKDGDSGCSNLSRREKGFRNQLF